MFYIFSIKKSYGKKTKMPKNRRPMCRLPFIKLNNVISRLPKTLSKKHVIDNNVLQCSITKKKESVKKALYIGHSKQI